MNDANKASIESRVLLGKTMSCSDGECGIWISIHASTISRAGVAGAIRIASYNQSTGLVIHRNLRVRRHCGASNHHCRGADPTSSPGQVASRFRHGTPLTPQII